MAARRKDRCLACLEQIEDGASVCSHCGSFQDRRRYLVWSLPTLSLALALALGVPTIVDIWKMAFHFPRSNITLLSLKLEAGRILAKAVNRGDAEGSIGSELNCNEVYDGNSKLSFKIMATDSVRALPNAEFRQNWEVWNVYVEGAVPEQADDAEIQRVARDLIAKFPQETPAPNDTDALVNAMSQGPYAPMYDEFRYFLVLAGHLALASKRPLPEEFSFSCQLDVADGTRTPHKAEFLLSFSPNSYGLTSEESLLAAASN